MNIPTLLDETKERHCVHKNIANMMEWTFGQDAKEYKWIKFGNKKAQL